MAEGTDKATGASDEGAKSAPVPLAPKLDAKPLLEIAEEKCPNCGAPMEVQDVVCLKCGFDYRANKVQKAEVGVTHVEEKKEPAEFVTPGRGSPRVLAVAGAVLTVGAMVAAGVYAPGGGKSGGIVIASVLLALYQALVHTGTGIVGVWVAARIREEKFTRVDLAAGRMFVAFALFLAVTYTRVPIGPDWVSAGLRWIAACGLYWLTVMVLFKKDRFETTLIALSHFVLWVLLECGIMLSAWMTAAGKV